MTENRIYIAGKITGDPDYMSKFLKAEYRLKDRGYKVLNPASLSMVVMGYLKQTGLEYDHKDWMNTVLPLLRHSDAIYLLEGWEQSPGAVEEYETAKKAGLEVLFEGNENH